MVDLRPENLGIMEILKTNVLNLNEVTILKDEVQFDSDINCDRNNQDLRFS